jgi:hypothetical protein
MRICGVQMAYNKFFQEDEDVSSLSIGLPSDIEFLSEC